MPKPKPKSPFREYAGVLVAFIVVIAFCSIGFLVMSSEVFLGAPVKPPSDWLAAMLSLASAALGYLIGKQVGQVDATSLVHDYEDPVDPRSPLCDKCGDPITDKDFEAALMGDTGDGD